VNYAWLPPGKYNFQVRACNNSGVWNEKAAVYAFSVKPYFWQRASFDTLAAALFMLALAGLVRHYSLRRAREMLRQAEQELALHRERSRIAQDMHDELGAQFTQISLLGELARTALAKQEKAADYLAKISSVASTGVKSLDEIVWAVNPRNDTLPDLLDYTGQHALNFLSAAGIQCRLDFPENPPARDIPGEVRHSVFLIVKEALNNVVRHAHASRVTLTFTSDEKEMRWAVEDNGIGFAEAPDNALADGLRNMSQRAEAIGGKVAITSVPGGGTAVRIAMPWQNGTVKP